MEREKKLINIIFLLKKDIFLKNNFFLKVFDRNIKIVTSMVGLKLAIYNGRYFVPLKITENMVGHLLGSFSFSHNILLFNKEVSRNYLKKKK